MTRIYVGNLPFSATDADFVSCSRNTAPSSR